MRLPLAYMMALAAASMPSPAERPDLGDDRRRLPPDTFVAPRVSNRAGGMNAAELQRYARKRQRQRQTHRGKRGKR
jgi:hypothetical protein